MARNRIAGSISVACVQPKASTYLLKGITETAHTNDILPHEQDLLPSTY